MNHIQDSLMNKFLITERWHSSCPIFLQSLVSVGLLHHRMRQPIEKFGQCQTIHIYSQRLGTDWKLLTCSFILLCQYCLAYSFNIVLSAERAAVCLCICCGHLAMSFVFPRLDLWYDDCQRTHSEKHWTGKGAKQAQLGRLWNCLQRILGYCITDNDKNIIV